MTTAFGVGVMMIVLLVGFAVMRQASLDSVPPTALPRDTAGDMDFAFTFFTGLLATASRRLQSTETHGRRHPHHAAFPARTGRHAASKS
jgi:hypothetical protein